MESNVQNVFSVYQIFYKRISEIYRHIILALRAHFIMENGHDYLVSEGKLFYLMRQMGD